MTIKREETYTVEFTKEQWRCIHILIANINRGHLISIMWSPSYSEELLNIIEGMRRELK